ncbi:hypothetical protein [Gaiella occulta]|uniref:hypothetical protein n=1 Tax=Gaiella occulta TaxID=1002870 RepID=UPI0011C04CCF|nr:hypothetical protein [Gaiella occulta]
MFRRVGAGTFKITTMLRSCTSRVARAPVGLLLALTMLGGFAAVARAAVPRSAIVTISSVRSPRGVLVTSGGWPYCEQARPLARRARLALVCGGYAKDGYRGRKLRHLRWLDWGNAAYLDELAARVAAVHRRIGGMLVFAGVSYSGYGVAVLAARHPELRPDLVVVVDSYLDLAARRAHLPAGHETAREIDRETGGTPAALARRSPNVDGLARLVRDGTKLVVVWSVADGERREFRGATCDATANAAPLAAVARRAGRPVDGWVTRSRHGATFWRYGSRLVLGATVGTKVTFTPNGAIPKNAVCS